MDSKTAFFKIGCSNDIIVDGELILRPGARVRDFQRSGHFGWRLTHVPESDYSRGHGLMYHCGDITQKEPCFTVYIAIMCPILDKVISLTHHHAIVFHIIHSINPFRKVGLRWHVREGVLQAFLAER